MEPRLTLITLGVADVSKARRFYEALGFVASSASEPGVAFFKAGGIVLALYGRTHLAADASIADGGASFSGISLAHNTRSEAEVDRVLAEAVRCGATLVKPAAKTFWGGYCGYFSDPDTCGRSPIIRPGLSTAPVPSSFPEQRLSNEREHASPTGPGKCPLRRDAGRMGARGA